jgi:glycerol transport system ATP-binding protein
MARIELSEIAHSYLRNPKEEADYALKRIHTTWEDGGAYALLGPSGCGKTTLLNIISGLLTPSSGRVFYNGKDVSELPPEKRNIAQVFQFPVLYDTMTVFGNLAFPLQNRGLPSNKITQRVHEVAEILDLTPFLKKRAAGLAADAKQKVSLGRGLVRSDVAAILFDEPLTVIDPQLKWDLRRKIKEIHEQLKLTFIYVTHDQVEALTFADKVVDGAGIKLDEKTAALGLKANGKLEVGIRPMYLKVRSEPVEGGVPAQVQAVEDQGSYKIVVLTLAGKTLRARLPEGKPVPDGKVWLVFPPKWIRLFADGRLIK